VLTLDLHAAQIQGFFDIPVDNLYASPIFALDIEHNFKGQMDDLMVVSPDVGGVARAREWPSGSTRRWPSSTSAARRRAKWPR
jgi:ribose-phosphate pyrophosphokinase